MSQDPTPAQRALLAVVALTLLVGAGGWLGLSYFGIVSKDVKVSVAIDELGDSLGPGAKVRFHGIIVGRVLRVGEHGDGYRVDLLVDAGHATSIPSGATARILPNTIFGSEYVELLGHHRTEATHVRSGDVLQADRSIDTLRLMDTFDDARRLITSVDVERINRVLNTVAPPIEGHGDDIADFIRRTDSYVTTLNADSGVFFETLRLGTDAADVLADAEPDLVSALASFRTTAGTIVEMDPALGRMLLATRDLADESYTLVDGHGDAVVTLSRTLAPLTATAARHHDDIRQILHDVPTVLHNGANAIDDNAIQMEGTVGVDPMSPYNAGDCPRYGTMTGSNCGNPIPGATSPSTANDPDLADVAGRVEDLLAQLNQQPDADLDTDGVSPLTRAPNYTASPVDGAGLVGDLFELLQDLGGSLTGSSR
ncbi:hypothetical protein C6I20_01465 [Aeromicrobium sp. A1-2]|uniref:MCE family protein n=1 Tax=Aeromicrobium sp. A1-2 TaxID=2107713 RepID=UPI000E54EA62|nr:MCE family protein [Aeromicrobium sp. A1-2]AXT83988.1 hypothetical protein C6I20_01465 [Aeromicrobium sp. A1-2]